MGYLNQRYQTTDSIRRVEAICNDIRQVKEEITLGVRSPIEGAKELFTIGYQREEVGLRRDADVVFQQTIALLEELYDSDNSLLTPHQLAVLAFEHGVNMFRLNRPYSAAPAFQRSVELFESLTAAGVSSQFIEEFATALTWLGLTQRRIKNYESAATAYERAMELWDQLVNYAPKTSTKPYRGLLGACMLGYAKSLEQMGKRRLAQCFRNECSKLLQVASSQKSLVFQARKPRPQ